MIWLGKCLCSTLCVAGCLLVFIWSWRIIAMRFPFVVQFFNRFSERLESALFFILFNFFLNFWKFWVRLVTSIKTFIRFYNINFVRTSLIPIVPQKKKTFCKRKKKIALAIDILSRIFYTPWMKLSYKNYTP